MSDWLTVNFWNSIAPMIFLCGLVVVLPNLLSRKNSESCRVLAWAVFKTATVAYAVGAILIALLYATINEGGYEQFIRNPIERTNFFLSRSALFALLWGPLLGFVWLVKAQELNRRIGEKMVDGEGGAG